MSYEDFMAMEERYDERAKEDLENLDEAEYFSNIADEIEQLKEYGSERENESGDRTGDESHTAAVAGGAGGRGSGGAEILQNAQPAYADGGVASVAGEGLRVDIGAENADSPGDVAGEASGRGIVGRSLSDEEVQRFIAFMEASADVAPEITLTPENWVLQFGEDGILKTPIGDVKQGDNQYLKLAQQGRNGKLGMIRPTLEHPHIIIEDERASDDSKSERDTSYVFIRTFAKKDGSRYYHFASITVSKGGKEVVISSQERSANRISKLLKQGKVTWIDEKFSLHPITQIGASVPLNDSNKPTTTDNQPALLGINSSEPNIFSERKDTDSASDKQEISAESSLGERVKAAEAEVNTDPTPAQKEAGNYKKGHVQVGTFDVTIEQPVGSVRRGTDADGKEWETTMQNTYGYIRGTEGVDGDHIDVFLSTDIDGWNGQRVVIVDQYNPDGSFDEHKVMLGFNAKTDAINAYLANYEKGWEKGRRLVFSTATLEDFEKWIESSHRKQKPYHEYKIAEKAEVEESTPGKSKQKEGVGAANIDSRSLIEDKLTEFAMLVRDAKTGDIPGIERIMSEWLSGQNAADLVGVNSRMLAKVCSAAGLDKGKAWAFRMSIDAAMPKDLLAEVWRLRNAGSQQRDTEGRQLTDDGNENGGNVPFSIGRESMQNGEVYNVGKSLLEAAGIEVVEIGDAEAQQQLEHKGDDVQLMGSRTDRKMEKIAEHYADMELDGNQRAAVDVFSGKRDNMTIEVERPEGTKRVVMRQGREPKAGAKHSLFRHFETESNRITADEIAMIPEIIAKGERIVNGKRVAYEYVAEDGTRLKVTTEIGDGRERFTNFMSNRKPLPSDRVENTQLSAHSSDAEVSGAKVGKISETDKPKLLKTLQSVVYGWTQGGKVYLNRDAMNPETPLHEYTHLWDEMVRRENPALWERGKELLRQTPLWAQVEADPNYADIRDDEDAVASEVHSRLVGEHGADVLDEMVKNAREEGVIDMAEAVSLIDRIKAWLADMFKSLKATLSQWSGADLKELSLEDFNNMTLRDLAEGVNPRAEIMRGDNARAAMEANPMEDDYHTGIRSRGDAKNFNEILAEAEKAWEEYGSLSYPDTDIDMLREAKRAGRITVYSSKPIKTGAFVTPSRMNAEDYAGGGRIYTAEVSVDEIAWISEDEGQMGRAHIEKDGSLQFHAAMSSSRTDFDAVRERAVAERGIVMPGLNEAEVRVVEVPRHDFGGDHPIAKARKWAKANIVGEHTLIDSSGAEVPYTISAKSIDKYLSETAIGKSANIGVHLAALKKLPEIVSESIEAEIHPDYTKNNHASRSVENDINPDNLIHRFYGAALIDGQIHRVKTTIIENGVVQKNKPHSYEVIAVELINDAESQPDNHGRIGRPRFSEEQQLELLEAPSDGVENNSGRPLAMTSNSSISATKLLQGVEKSYDPGVKILEASKNALAEALGQEQKNDGLERMGDGYGAYSDAEVSFANDPTSKVMGKNRFSKKRQAEFAARERQRMAARIQDLAGRMRLDNVEIVTDVSQLDGKRVTAKGFYNKRTGRITIVIPNNVSTIDAEQTLLHEAVAHYGLRQLFGEQFDTFLDNVYDSADDGIRRKINELAAKNGWNIHTATEEYLAGLAENTNFEEARNYGGWWSKIKQLFLNMVEKIGFEGFRDNTDVVLTDNELRYILWRSYENLAEPGRYRSIIGEAMDVSMQSELKVGNYAEGGIEAEYAAEPISVINTLFNNQLNKYISGELSKQEMLRLGNPRGIMQLFLPDLPIIMRQRVIKKGSEKKHEVDVASLCDMPERLSSPIFVFQRSENTIGILTDIKDRNGKNVCVAIEIKRQIQDGKEHLEVNDVRSFHGREFKNIIEPIVNNNTLKWVDKEKGLAYLSSASQQVQQEIDKQALEDAAKIVENFENPTIDGQYNNGAAAETVRAAVEEDGNPAPGKEVADDDILFRSAADYIGRDRALARQLYERSTASQAYIFREAYQDCLLGLRRLYESVEKATGSKRRVEEVSSYENAYTLAVELSSRDLAEQTAYERLIMTPLLGHIARMSKNAAGQRKLIDYMMAKHGLERNAYMRQKAAEWNAKLAADQAAGERKKERARLTRRDFAGLTGLTGMDDWRAAEAEARKMVSEYEVEHGKSDIDKLWDLVNQSTKATLTKMLETGLISKEKHDDIAGMYKYYIPLRGWDETTTSDVYAYLTGKDGGLSGPIKKAEGRNSKADDPLAAIFVMMQSAIQQGNRNKAKERLLFYAMNHPSDLMSVSRVWLEYNDVDQEWVAKWADIDVKDSPEEAAAKVRDFEERMEQLRKQDPKRYKLSHEAPDVPYRIAEKQQQKEHQVIVKRGGVMQVITINGSPRAAQAINGITNPDNPTTGIGVYLSGLMAVNRGLSSMYTTRNPEFVLSNFARDGLYALTTAPVKEGVKYGVRYYINYGIAFVNIARLMGCFSRNELDMSKPIERMFHEFMMNGGETGYTNARNIERQKKENERVIRQSRRGKYNAFRLLGVLGDKLDYVNRNVENVARFATYMTSREVGRDIQRSVYDAKEITVNFNKKGAGSKFINDPNVSWWLKLILPFSDLGRANYVFWNAAIQGTANHLSLFKRNFAGATLTSAMFFGLGALMSWIGLGDDDDDNAYHDQPESTRRSNIMFKVGKYFGKIPLGVEQRIYYGLGELAMSVCSGKEKYSGPELAREVASIMSQALPLDFMDGGGVIHAVTPSYAKPAVEAWTNTSWTGLPIYRENEHNEDAPEWTKAYEKTNKHIVALCKTLNEISGGTHREAKIGDLNPAIIEHLLKGYFGGPATMVDKTVKTAEMLAGKREADIRNIPFVSRFVAKGDERTANRRMTSQFFDYKEECEKTSKLLKGYTFDVNDGLTDMAERVSAIYSGDEFLRYEIYEMFKGDLKAYDDVIKDEPDEAMCRELEAERDAIRRNLVSALDEPELYLESHGIEVDSLRKQRADQIAKAYASREKRRQNSRKKLERIRK